MAITVTEENVEEFLRTLLDSEDIPTDTTQLCSDLIFSLSLHSKVVPLVGEVLAALSCEESFREQAGKNNVLSALLPFLSASDVCTRLQVLRAIGNLCIDNDGNREVVLKAGGCQTLTEQICRCCDCDSEEFTNDRFKCVACGCILNVAADNERLAQEFLSKNAHEEISSLLSISDQSENVIKYGLQALCILVDGTNLEDKKTSLLLNAIFQLLMRANKEECGYLKLTLELAKEIIEKGEAFALEMVNLGIVKHILGVQQLDARQQALDLLVLLLGKDKCMEVIFEDNETLCQIKMWLEAPTQFHMANAALVVANMARSDSNCISLVKNGFVPLLIAIVKQKEIESMEGKLHHAALSALRNLSLPAEHKEEFFSMGVVDCAIYALKNSTLSHVQFKAIGILRLLVENQASTCSYVITEAMETLMKVCTECGISHVHIETGRLLAAVTKYCQDKSVILKVTNEGGIKWIYQLMQCEEPQLIAEGLMAINIILFHTESVTLFCTEASSSIVKCLHSILTASFPLNLVNNSLALMKTLLSVESEMKCLLVKNSEPIKQVLHDYLSHDNEEIRLKTKEILELLS